MVINIYGLAYYDDKNCVFVKSILGAKTKCMKSYIIPTAEFEPEVIVLHCGTNDLRRTLTPEAIAREIVALGPFVKTAKNVIIISGIIAHKDRYKVKARDTNECLKKLCNSSNILFVGHSNIDVRAHINYGGLHLNYRGSKLVGKNILNVAKSLRLWY